MSLDMFGVALLSILIKLYYIHQNRLFIELNKAFKRLQFYFYYKKGVLFMKVYH